MEKIPSLWEFKNDIAEGLKSAFILQKKFASSTARHKNRRKSESPADSKRYDKVSHFPNCSTKSFKECIKSHTRIKCLKCNVGLCLNKSKNGFIKYHQK